MIPVVTEARAGLAGKGSAGSASGPPGPPVVAVANRLPVRHGDDGWELSPGGLVTALRPVMANHRAPGSAGTAAPRGCRPRCPAWTSGCCPIRLVRGPAPRLLPRVRQRDAVAAAARRDRETALRARLVAQLPGRQRRLRRAGAGRARRAAGRARLGPRLPPDARSAADQGAAARSADRLLPARALAVAGHLRPRCPGGRRSCSACSAPTWSPSTPSATATNFVQACAPPAGRRLASRCDGSAIMLPDQRRGVDDHRADLDRRGRVQPGSPATRRPAVKSRRSASSSRAGRCCSASTGSTTPRASSSGCWRSRCSSSGAADLRTKLAFLQVAVPSRDDVREYRNLRAAVERHIGRINGQFTEPGSDVPVHYLYRGLPQRAARRLLRGRRRLARHPARSTG